MKSEDLAKCSFFLDGKNGCVSVVFPQDSKSALPQCTDTGLGGGYLVRESQLDVRKLVACLEVVTEEYSGVLTKGDDGNLSHIFTWG